MKTPENVFWRARPRGRAVYVMVGLYTPESVQTAQL